MNRIWTQTRSKTLNWFWRAALLLGGVMASAPQARAQTGASVTVDSRVDKAEITIGDTVRYTLRLSREARAQVRWPSLGANLGAFEIRNYHKPEPRTENNRILEEISYTISTFDTGRFVIPPLVIEYLMPPDTAWQALHTESLEIHVRSLLSSEAGDIREVKSPWELPRDWRRVVLIATLVGVLIVLAALGYVWWRKRQGKGLLPQRIEPQRPPHEMALEELAQLRTSDLLARGEIKLFYSLLSEILRRYFEGRYGLAALEMTTMELDRELRQVEPAPQACDEMRDLLEMCDLVKFAKFIPAHEEAALGLERATAFVESTKPVTLEASAQNGAPAAAAETNLINS